MKIHIISLAALVATAHGGGNLRKLQDVDVEVYLNLPLEEEVRDAPLEGGDVQETLELEKPAAPERPCPFGSMWDPTESVCVCSGTQKWSALFNVCQQVLVGPGEESPEAQEEPVDLPVDMPLEGTPEIVPSENEPDDMLEEELDPFPLEDPVIAPLPVEFEEPAPLVEAEPEPLPLVESEPEPLPLVEPEIEPVPMQEPEPVPQSCYTCAANSPCMKRGAMKNGGLHPHCEGSRFIQCGGAACYELRCPGSLVFNDNTRTCDWPY